MLFELYLVSSKGFHLGTKLKGKRIVLELNMLAVEDKSVVYTSFAKPDPKAGSFNHRNALKRNQF